MIKVKDTYTNIKDYNFIKQEIDYIISKPMKTYDVLVRIMDVICSIIGLAIAIPLTLIFGLIIYIEDKGNIIYSQERLGKDGKVFKVRKLRSMRMDAEKYGAQWAQDNDPRVLKVGKFIRKTRIDELPQLLNVLQGDMSIIGPRPERPMFTMQFEDEIPGFVDRLAIKPGLTGWAQVNGGYDITPEEKLKLDLYYIKNRSIVLDIKIVIKTFGVLLTGSGAR